MERRSVLLLVAALILTTGFALARAEGERLNKSAPASASASASFWSGTKDELKPEADDDDGLREADGGFSSLDSMLQWAIGHSDPEKLEEAAIGIQGLSSEELQQRQMEIKELMDKLKTPSDAKLMKIAIDDLNNVSLPLEDRHRALQELLILVEPIDNANDLHKLGGLTAVIGELYNPNSQIRTISAWVLGKASQNNHLVQNQILELGTLAKLIEMARSNITEEATKALYAVSALIRNNIKGQELFYMEAGDVMLQNILSNSSIDIGLQRKSVFLLADLAEFQLDSRSNTEQPLFSNHSLLKSVVNLLATKDLDLQEKTLYAVKNLLLLRSVDALVFKDVCKLDVVLERMRQRLQQLILDDTFTDYAQDIENLRAEVELIFLGKLEKAKSFSESGVPQTHPNSFALM